MLPGVGGALTQGAGSSLGGGTSSTGAMQVGAFTAPVFNFGENSGQAGIPSWQVGLAVGAVLLFLYKKK